MKINVKNNRLLSASLYELDLLTNRTLSLKEKILKALNSVSECTDNDILTAQVYSFSIDAEISPEYLTVNIDDTIFENAKAIISQQYPQTRITNSFVLRIAVNVFLLKLKSSTQVEITDNRNQNVLWADQNNISYDARIYQHGKPIPEIRGVYCITMQTSGSKEVCLYVGRSNSIYARLFMGNCHIYAMRTRSHLPSINQAVENKVPLHIKVLEEVPLVNDHPAKDAQRLASRENYWIDFYQNSDMCLEQYPEGRWI